MQQLPERLKRVKPLFPKRQGKQQQSFPLEKLTQIRVRRVHRNISSVQTKSERSFFTLRFRRLGAKKCFNMVCPVNYPNCDLELTS